MANNMQLKRSSVPGKVPDASNVLVGEPVVNLADRILYTKDGSGNVIVVGSNLTIQLANTSNTVSKSVSDVRVIQFDDDSGFDIIDRANGIAKVQMNSTFKTWNVLGQSNLVASGLDVVRFVPGSFLDITTNAFTYPQEIRFDARISAGQNITIDANGRINSTATGGGGGTGLIKTYNILNDFSAPLLGTQIFVPVQATTIRRIQITNGEVAGVDIMLGLYKNNDLIIFVTLPAGNVTTTITGLSYYIQTNDFITVNVVAGSGKNLMMSIFDT